MLFFFEEEQLDNGSATTSQKEFPKDGNRRYTKFPVNVANFILVKQVFGLTKERTNTSTSMHSNCYANRGETMFTA